MVDKNRLILHFFGYVFSTSLLNSCVPGTVLGCQGEQGGCSPYSHGTYILVDETEKTNG